MLKLKKVILFALLFFASSTFAWYEEFDTKVSKVVYGEDYIAIESIGVRESSAVSLSNKSFIRNMKLFVNEVYEKM